MKKLQNRFIGVDQGETVLFSDYRDGGEMWTGQGPRECRQRVEFSDRFRSPPSVHCSLSLWDMDHGANIRADLVSENVDDRGFDLVFRTWGDTRIARARTRWMAIGELANGDDWDV
jgi:hypothetical protein